MADTLFCCIVYHHPQTVFPPLFEEGEVVYDDHVFCLTTCSGRRSHVTPTDTNAFVLHTHGSVISEKD